MKHIFVVNPHAGGRDQTELIRQRVEHTVPGAELYVTQKPQDATRYVAGRVAAEGGAGLRFYACGGDGTLNEVCTGLAGSAAEVACLPYGSGNDYIKCWPEADFTDLERQVAGRATAVDLMRVNDRYCLNVLNLGFEAEVCRTMQRVRHWPLLGGRMAYTTGIVDCILRAMHTRCSISVDGQPWHSGDTLLGSAANGQYVGGGFRCAPRAVVDDGELEIMCVDSIKLPRFLQIIGHYRAGQHLDMPQFADVIHYRRGHRMSIDSEHEVPVVVDGELISARHVEVAVMPKAINFVIPQTV